MALNSYEIDPLIDALRGHRLGATANDRLLAGQLASQEIAWRRDTHREPAMNGITIITSNHNGNNNNNPFYTEYFPPLRLRFLILSHCLRDSQIVQ